MTYNKAVLKCMGPLPRCRSALYECNSLVGEIFISGTENKPAVRTRERNVKTFLESIVYSIVCFLSKCIIIWMLE